MSSEDFVDAPKPYDDTKSDKLFYSSSSETRQPNQALASFFQSILDYNLRMADTTMTDGTITAAKEARMGVPTPFSGKRRDLKKFLMTCKMHLQANWAIYDNDEKKVVFVLSFMTEGDTATWREQWLDDLDTKAKALNKTEMDFRTLAELITLLEKDFAAYDAPGDALENMKNLWYDTKASIEDHISRFKTLLSQSGMKESISVINYFRQTLPINLQRKIMLLDNPPITLDDWYKWTKQVGNTYKKMQRMLGKIPEKKDTKEEPKKCWNFPKTIQMRWM